jgi:iron-sulfur cluster repair protein YtfE (RIC family)
VSGDEITPDMTIREAMELCPATRAVFARHRLDTCCGGGHAIAVAALARGLDPDRFLREVRDAVGVAPI